MFSISFFFFKTNSQKITLPKTNSKLAKVKDEPSPHPIPVSASSTSLGGTIMASLAHRFQTIRQLESEDLRSERGDDDLSGFEDDDDDDESYFY